MGNPLDNRERKGLQRAIDTIRRHRADLLNNPGDPPEDESDETNEETFNVPDQLKKELIRIIKWLKEHPEHDDGFMKDLLDP